MASSHGSAGKAAATEPIEVPAQAGPLLQGWAWLDERRRLAVPLTATAPGGSGRDTPLAGWRAPSAGPGRDYAVHLDTGVVVMRDRTVLELTDGWRRQGEDLVHLAGSVALRAAGATIGGADLTQTMGRAAG